MAEAAGESQKRLVAEEITTRTTTHTISIERETTCYPGTNVDFDEETNFDLDSSLNLKSKREEENAVLAALNRRFAVVVDRNAALEKEVAKLREQVDVGEKTRVETIREVTRVQGEATDDLRRQLAREKKLRRQTEAELADATDALEKATRLRNNALEKIKSLEKEILQLRNSLSEEQKKLLFVQEEFTNLEMMNEDLARKLAEAESKAEREFLGRVDVEKTLEKERHDWSLEKQIIETDVLQKNCAYETSLEKIAEQKEKEYEAKLEKMLEVLRKEMAGKIAELKEALEKLKDDEVEEIETKWRSEVTRVREELSETVKRLGREKEELERILRSLQVDREEERLCLESQLEERRQEIEEIRRQRKSLLENWRNLLESKTTLHSELSVYELLLQSEEARISRTDSNNGASAASSHKNSNCKSFQSFPSQ